jgi:hypothetical protein
VKNMLCFGHQEEAGRFAPTSSELKQVADELAPLFWDYDKPVDDPGVIPGNETSPTTALTTGHRLIQRFRSPYPGLYRLEFELAAPPQPCGSCWSAKPRGTPTLSYLMER